MVPETCSEPVSLAEAAARGPGREAVEAFLESREIRVIVLQEAIAQARRDKTPESSDIVALGRALLFVVENDSASALARLRAADLLLNSGAQADREVQEMMLSRSVTDGEEFRARWEALLSSVVPGLDGDSLSSQQASAASKAVRSELALSGASGCNPDEQRLASALECMSPAHLHSVNYEPSPLRMALANSKAPTKATARAARLLLAKGAVVGDSEARALLARKDRRAMLTEEASAFGLRGVEIMPADAVEVLRESVEAHDSTVTNWILKNWPAGPLQPRAPPEPAGVEGHPSMSALGGLVPRTQRTEAALRDRKLTNWTIQAMWRSDPNGRRTAPQKQGAEMAKLEPLWRKPAPRLDGPSGSNSLLR
eukprot:gnl/MRDRNA2_/MRDRNA2_79365_c0_seq1.p1 gnl/MRDRNA2_/MRDRNA2_79365_c0~~gnl/MRDRNA2_/MRDRNA2_79365_c0_seq1.p1  ORF type:complete len:402 (+),score=89.00 gnl/MRDRNA2_/MRDRNA2_79365_c0_seq1:102-1208(+)